MHGDAFSSFASFASRAASLNSRDEDRSSCAVLGQLERLGLNPRSSTDLNQAATILDVVFRCFNMTDKKLEDDDTLQWVQQELRAQAKAPTRSLQPN